MIILIVISIIICTFLLFNILYKKTNAFNNHWYMHRDFINKNDCQCLILGSTYGRYSFDGFKSLNFLVTNYAVSSQSISNDYYNYKKIKNKNQGKYVLITISPCTMLYDGGRDFLKFRIPGKNDSSIKQFIDFYFPLIKPKRWLNFIVDEPLLFDIYENKGNLCTEKSIVDEMNRITRVWLKTFNIKNLTDPLDDLKKIIIERNTIILDRLVKECVLNGDRPIVVIVPFSNKLNKYFSEDFVCATLEEPIKKLSNNNPDLTVLNYRSDSVFQDDLGLYLDGGFLLNRRGSVLLIRRVFDDIPELFLKIKGSEQGVKND